MRLVNPIFDVFFGGDDSQPSSSSREATTLPTSSSISTKRRSSKYYTRPVFKEPASMDEYLLSKQRQEQRQQQQLQESRTDTMVRDDSGSLLSADRDPRQYIRPSIVDTLRPSIVEEIFGYASSANDDFGRDSGGVGRTNSNGASCHRHRKYDLHHEVCCYYHEAIEPTYTDRIQRLRRSARRPAAAGDIGTTGVLLSSSRHNAASTRMKYPRAGLQNRQMGSALLFDTDDFAHMYADDRDHHRRRRHHHHHHHHRCDPHRKSFRDDCDGCDDDDNTESGSSIVSVSNLDMLAARSLRTGNKDGHHHTTSKHATGRDDLATIREKIVEIIDDDRDDLELIGLDGLHGCLKKTSWTQHSVSSNCIPDLLSEVESFFTCMWW